MNRLTEFVRESNRIEGILREPSNAEINAQEKLLHLEHVTTDNLEAFVSVIAPGHELRRHIGLDVSVGEHIAPPGGANIVVKLDEILDDVLETDPYFIHQRYEHLHPFTDGNGRSGRALWLWTMQRHGMLKRALALGFLHNWYYSSLSHHR